MFCRLPGKKIINITKGRSTTVRPDAGGIGRNCVHLPEIKYTTHHHQWKTTPLYPVSDPESPTHANTNTKTKVRDRNHLLNINCEQTIPKYPHPPAQALKHVDPPQDNYPYVDFPRRPPSRWLPHNRNAPSRACGNSRKSPPDITWPPAPTYPEFAVWKSAPDTVLGQSQKSPMEALHDSWKPAPPLLVLVLPSSRPPSRLPSHPPFP